MVKESVKTNKKLGEEAEALETIDVPVVKAKPKYVGEKIKFTHSPEYSRGIAKIASYSGTVRRMTIKDGVMKNKEGKWEPSPFKEIINIYVQPNGEVDYDRTRFTNTQRGNTTISKQKVRTEGSPEKAAWYRRELETKESGGKGSPYLDRKKKQIKPKTKRLVKKTSHKSRK